MSGGNLTTNGKKILLDRAYNATPTRGSATAFKVGIGTTDFAVSQTDLITSIPITGVEVIDSCDAITGWSTSADVGLLVNTTTYKTTTGSLQLTKLGNTEIQATANKATTSRDLTGKTYSIWVYVIDDTMKNKFATASCVECRLGSDSSNYFKWTKNRSNLTGGQWNLLNGFSTANAVVVGSPVTASLDYSDIRFTAASTAVVWEEGDLMFDDIKVISADDYTKMFEGGYPTFDYDNLQVTIRTRLSTLDAEGYGISEFGLFNTDSSTALMESRDSFTAISKSGDDEIIFICKTIIE